MESKTNSLMNKQLLEQNVEKSIGFVFCCATQEKKKMCDRQRYLQWDTRSKNVCFTHVLTACCYCCRSLSLKCAVLCTATSWLRRIRKCKITSTSSSGSNNNSIDLQKRTNVFNLYVQMLNQILLYHCSALVHFVAVCLFFVVFALSSQPQTQSQSQSQPERQCIVFELQNVKCARSYFVRVFFTKNIKHIGIFLSLHVVCIP